MDITGYRPHAQPTRRVTLDTMRAAPRTQTYDRTFAMPRHKRQVVRRAGHPQKRQPRVRLGKPTGPNTYVHWQDYLDIADLHKAPKVTSHSNATLQAEHQETMSEMLERYRDLAQSVSDKLGDLFHGSYQPVEVTEVITPDEIIN